MSSSERAATPVVSIGMSVFNGEGVLEEAVRSVLAQTRDDLELIICDNASGDRSAVICRDLCARDARIRYFRSPRNLGLRASYLVALSRARGRCFKWMLHEDRLEPAYIAETLRVLEERRDVALCNSVIARINGHGDSVDVLDSGLARADSASMVERFSWAVSGPHTGVELYGLGRTDLLRTLPYGQFPGAERARVARLAMRGRLVQLPVPLLKMREHPHRQAREMPADNDSSALRTELLKLLGSHELSLHERMRCLGVLAQAWTPGYAQMRPTLVQLAALVRRAQGGTSLMRRAQGAAGRSRGYVAQLMAQRRRI